MTPSIAVLDRAARRLALVGATAFALTLATPRAADALTITAVYGNSTAFTAAQQTVIANAINFYQTTFSDPITVTIAFWSSSSVGLGQSVSFITNPSWTAFRAALVADATSANDATAIATVPGGSTDPLIGQSKVQLKVANARALGANVFGGTIGTLRQYAGYCDGVTGVDATIVDGCIGINGGLTTTSPPSGGLYSLISVVQHEIDEVLGLGSGLYPGGYGYINPEDLFRYASAGVRTYANYSCNASHQGPSAYFSINGGTTNLDSFNNCDNGGDYGDWVYGNPDQVQNAFGTPGGNASLNANSAEVVALDVIGYDLYNNVNNPVPEPATMSLLAMGLTAMAGAGIRRRRKNAVK